MKQTILFVLMMVVVTTPCFAQEIEPEGIFSIEGTRWQRCPTLTIFLFPNIGCEESEDSGIGFYQGKVYSSMIGFNSYMLSFYVDTLGVSTYFACKIVPPILTTVWETGFMFPALGLGMGVTFGIMHLVPVFSISILTKVEENWIPPESISMISPIQGEPGTTLTDVTILSINTTFQNNPPVEVIFDPPDGLTVSNIDVIDNTEIEFDLEISVDAPLGIKRVIVTYDDGKKVVDSSDVLFGDGGFEVVRPPRPAPPGEIVSISPNQGEQGTTLTDVTIIGADTTFEDYGVSAILLMPPGGVTVSNIDVISNTEIEFDLEIAVDAPVGPKSVIVTYDEGIGYLYNSEVVFEILEKTN